MRRRRTEITIESNRRLVVSEFRSSFTAWCDECMAEVRMITPNEGAAKAGISSRGIYRWIELGQLHFSEKFGLLLVCENSLIEHSARSQSLVVVDGLKRGDTT